MRGWRSHAFYVYFAFFIGWCICTCCAQFPRICTTAKALKDRECCPYVTDETGKTSKCGYHIGRGRCENIDFPKYEFDPKVTIELLFDDRKDWPRAFYDRACQCDGNFGGIGCNQCKHGYYGSQCMKKKNVAVRRNILSFSESEIDEFLRNLNQSKFVTSEQYVILTTSYDEILLGEEPTFSNISIYDLFVWMHYYASRSNLILDTDDLGSNSKVFTDIFTQTILDRNFLKLNDDHDYAHSGPAFLPWHRYFMLKWEAEFQANIVKDSDFTIPYWDWRQTNTCDICTNRLFGAKNPSSPQHIDDRSLFSSWKTICTKTREDDYLLKGKQCDGAPETPLYRNYGEYDDALSSGLPSFDDVSNSLRFARYETPPFDESSNLSLRNVMEGFAYPNNGSASSEFSTMHNAVHLFMNGSMSDVGSSANDPLFILHHAFVDGIYEEWLRRHSLESILVDLSTHENEIPVGHNLKDFMVPFFPLIRQIEGFLPSKKLGYSYDFIEDAVGSGMMDGGGDLTDLPTREILPIDFRELEDAATEVHFEALVGQPMLNEQTENTRRRSSTILSNELRHNYPRSQRRYGEGDSGYPMLTSEFSSTETPDKNDDFGKDVASSWDRIAWKRYFANLTIKEQVLLLSMFAATVVCVIIWIALCCKCWRQLICRPSRMSSKGRHLSRCVCCRKRIEAYYDDEDGDENQSLLEDANDRKVTLKRKKDSYPYQEMKMRHGKVSFDEI